MIARITSCRSAARTAACAPCVRLRGSSRTSLRGQASASSLRQLPVGGADFLRAGRKVLAGGVGWSIVGSLTASSLLSVAPTEFAAMVAGSGVLSSLFIGASTLSAGSLGLWRGSMNAADLLVVQRRLLTGPVTRFVEERLSMNQVPPEEGGELLKLAREGYNAFSDAVRSRGIVSRTAVALVLPSLDSVLDGVETELDAAAGEGTVVTPPTLLAAVANGILRERILYCRDTPTYVFFVSYFALFGSASTLYAWIGG